MTEKYLARFGGITSIIAGSLLLVWWILMGIMLPQAEAKESFDVIVTHSNWIPINIIGFMAVLIFAISLFLLYKTISEHLSKTGFFGFILGEIGIIWFACIQYYETFIWPLVGELHPELVKIDGALVFGNSIVMIPLILSGLVLGIGYLLFCIDLLKHNIVPKLVVWFLLIGVILFGNGLIAPIRTIGLILLVYSLIRVGLLQYREKLTSTVID